MAELYLEYWVKSNTGKEKVNGKIKPVQTTSTICDSNKRAKCTKEGRLFNNELKLIGL